MAWIITKDHIHKGEEFTASRKGWRSADYREGMELPHPFKMYDSDGILYYEGLSSSCDDEEAFNPLDELGTPDAGCVSIHYQNPHNGKFEML